MRVLRGTLPYGISLYKGRTAISIATSVSVGVFIMSM
jgi:hypothetical protein